MRLTGAYEPSAWEPVAEQVSLYEATDGVEGADFMGGPCIVLTTIGAQSGKLRKTPLIRVEQDGTYVAIASVGGSPTDPGWAHNLRAHPRCDLQDGAVVHELVAREVTGVEKAGWWSAATQVWPAYDDYQAATDRVIPLFVLEQG